MQKIVIFYNGSFARDGNFFNIDSLRGTYSIIFHIWILQETMKNIAEKIHPPSHPIATQYSNHNRQIQAPRKNTQRLFLPFSPSKIYKKGRQYFPNGYRILIKIKIIKSSKKAKKINLIKKNKSCIFSIFSVGYKLKWRQKITKSVGDVFLTHFFPPFSSHRKI